MELKDTVNMILSEDYTQRFKAEYAQLLIRRDNLSVMVKKYREGTLNFTPKCSLILLGSQLITMNEYIECLESRAQIEGISLAEFV